MLCCLLQNKIIYITTTRVLNWNLQLNPDQTLIIYHKSYRSIYPQHLTTIDCVHLVLNEW